MKRLFLFVLAMSLSVLFVSGCSKVKVDVDATSTASLTDGNKIHIANDLADAINGNSDDSKDENETEKIGVVDVNGSMCDLYKVTLDNGKTEYLAVDENGNWYMKQNNECYVSVVLGADGSITIGQENSDSETPESIALALAKCFMSSDDCAVEEKGNGLVNKQNCVFFQVSTSSGDTGVLAYAQTEDGSWYFKSSKLDFYRMVIRENGAAWLGKPVDNETKAAQWVAGKIKGVSGGVAIADSVVNFNAVDCTKYRYEYNGNVVSYIIVGIDGSWYYGDLDEDYKVIQFTNKGIVI